MAEYQFPPQYTIVTIDMDGYVRENDIRRDYDSTPLNAKVDAREQWDEVLRQSEQGLILHAFFYVEPQPGYDRGRHLIASL